MIIDIFGMKVPVVLKEGLTESTGHLGEYCYENKLIEIDMSLDGEKLDKTLFHETIHALFDRTGISDYFGENEGKDIEHTIITVLEQFMFETYYLQLKQGND